MSLEYVITPLTGAHQIETYILSLTYHIKNHSEQLGKFAWAYECKKSVCKYWLLRLVSVCYYAQYQYIITFHIQY